MGKISKFKYQNFSRRVSACNNDNYMLISGAMPYHTNYNRHSASFALNPPIIRLGRNRRLKYVVTDRGSSSASQRLFIHMCL